MMQQLQRMRRKFGPQEPHSIDEMATAQSPNEETDQGDG